MACFRLCHKLIGTILPNSFGKDLIQHNLVVFRNGEGALQVLPPLVDVIPEARLNLVIYFLRQDDVNEAYSLIKDLEPTVPQEYILKGRVNTNLRKIYNYCYLNADIYTD